MINCLENKKIVVKHVFKETSRFLDKKHVLYGGMIDGAFKTYTLPKSSSGVYKRVLTDEEEEFLEDYMKLEKGSLSIHRRNDNYWDNVRVRLGKEDTFFNMSNPEDYIKIKVLLANTDFICPNLKVLESRPLPTYEYVVVDDGEQDKLNMTKLSNTMNAYKLLGKIEEDTYKLKVILEILEKKNVSEFTTTEALLNKINDHITMSPKKFIDVVQDEYLNSKVLLRKCIDIKVVTERGGFLYLSSDGSPLCDSGNPTIDVAAMYINMPNNANIKFLLESEVKRSTRFGNGGTPKPDPLPELKEDTESVNNIIDITDTTKEKRGRKPNK